MVIGGAGLSPAAMPVFDMALYGGIVIAAILALGVLLVAMRRRLHGQPGRGGGDLSVEQVEQLRRNGTISDEEFATLRRRALGLGAARAESDNGIMNGAKNVDEDEDMEQGQG